MSAPRHTPPPWTYELGDWVYVVLSANRELVGKAVGQNQQTDEANARLFAAAPEMLKALIEIEKGLSTLDAARLAAKALAKATGGEK